MLKRLLKDESGAVATEYVVLTGLVAIALITGIVLFRDELMNQFNNFIAWLKGKNPAPPT